MRSELSRRCFLSRAGSSLSAVWISTHWSSLLSAATHAHHATKSDTPVKFEFFTQEEGTEIEAITARIIPSDGTPGAREAGAVYFIDRALTTFAKDSQKMYREGLPALQARVTELFPGVSKFSAATAEQQDKVLESLDEFADGGGRRAFRPAKVAPPFFEVLRQHTIMAFLIDPESDRRGNRDGVGWKLIGREPAHAFQPPFGFYDKDYPGWQPLPASGDKK